MPHWPDDIRASAAQRIISPRRAAGFRVARGSSTMFAIADGFSWRPELSVVWLQASATAAASAWFGTVVRLFQTLFGRSIADPAVKLYRMLEHKSIAQRQAFTGHALVGLCYGTIVAWTRRCIATLC
jgi:hypothetical protein